MTNTRKDIHRPAEIKPTDYKYLFSYSYPGLNGAPGINLTLLAAVRTGETQKEPVYGFDYADTIAFKIGLESPKLLKNLLESED